MRGEGAVGDGGCPSDCPSGPRLRSDGANRGGGKTGPRGRAAAVEVPPPCPPVGGGNSGRFWASAWRPRARGRGDAPVLRPRRARRRPDMPDAFGVRRSSQLGGGPLVGSSGPSGSARSRRLSTDGAAAKRAQGARGDCRSTPAMPAPRRGQLGPFLGQRRGEREAAHRRLLVTVVTARAAPTPRLRQRRHRLDRLVSLLRQRRPRRGGPALGATCQPPTEAPRYVF